MKMISPGQYLNTVIQSFGAQDAISLKTREEVIDWLRCREDPAEEFVAELSPQVYRTSRTRYRFSAEPPRAQLIKMIFEVAFRAAPARILEKAQQVRELSLRRRIGKVIWIDAPQLISSFLRNRKIIDGLFSIVIFGGAFFGYRLYRAIASFTEAKAIPFLVRSAHPRILQIFRTTALYFGQIYKKRLLLFFPIRLGAVIVLTWPQLSRCFPLARWISGKMVLVTFFWTFLTLSQTVYFFLFWMLIDARLPVREGVVQIASSLSDFSQANRAKFYTKEEAYQLWVQSLESN